MPVIPLGAYWPLIVLFLIAGAIMVLPDLVRLLVRHHNDKRLAQLGIADIDKLDGHDFERLLTQVFAERGAKIVLTPKCNDWGADLVVDTGGVRTVVQAKRWSKRVGVKAVQEAYTSKPVYKAERAIVVTNSSFTRAAIELARKCDVELWDRHAFVERLLATQAKRAA